MYARERNAAANDATVRKRRGRPRSPTPEKSTAPASHCVPRGTIATTPSATAAASASCPGRSDGRAQRPHVGDAAAARAAGGGRAMEGERVLDEWRAGGPPAHITP